MRAIEACPAAEEEHEKQEIVSGAITAAAVVSGLIALVSGIMLIQGMNALLASNLLVFGASTYFIARGSVFAASSALMLYVVNYLLLFLDHGLLGTAVPILVGIVLQTGVLATMARRDKSPPTEGG